MAPATSLGRYGTVPPMRGTVLREYVRTQHLVRSDSEHSCVCSGRFGRYFVLSFRAVVSCHASFESAIAANTENLQTFEKGSSPLNSAKPRGRHPWLLSDSAVAQGCINKVR